MAVSTDNAFSGPYTANGVTTVFPFTFTAPSVDEVGVLLRTADGSEVQPGGFTVSLGANGAGGNIVFSSAPAAGISVTPFLDPSFTQDLQFENGSAWLAGPVNEGYDRSALRDQVLRREVDRALKVPMGAEEIGVGTIAEGQVLGLVGGKLKGVNNDPVSAADSAALAVAAKQDAQASKASAQASAASAEENRILAQQARADAVEAGDQIRKATWAELAAVTTEPTGRIGVSLEKSGTHGSLSGDVGASGGQTPNGGQFRFASGTGWVRLGDMDWQLAQAARDAAQSWAIGTEPGGPGTKSAKEWVEEINPKLGELAPQSGYVSAITDGEDNILLGFDEEDGRPIFGKGGDVIGRIEDVEASIEPLETGRSGIIFAVEDDNGNTPLTVGDDGETYVGEGLPVYATLKYLLEQVGGGNTEPGIPIYPTDDINGGGDSLTNYASSGNWVGKLASLTGRQVADNGIGGQGSRQIAARLNGTPVRFAAFIIPTTTAATTVTVSGWSPCSNGMSVAMTVAGIAGTLAKSSDGLSHTFARAVAGPEAIVVPAGTPGLTVAGEQYRDRILIAQLWRNSFLNSSGDALSTGQMIAAGKSLLDYQNAQVKRAIFWSIPPWDTETTGTANRTRLDTVNAALADAFPEYWLDLSAWLRTNAPTVINPNVSVDSPFTAAGITATADDLTDIANGITPRSFRIDGGHFNDAGGTAIAYRFHQELRIRGWIN